MPGKPGSLWINAYCGGFCGEVIGNFQANRG
jgi:hypothetical protein